MCGSLPAQCAGNCLFIRYGPGGFSPLRPSLLGRDAREFDLTRPRERKRWEKEDLRKPLTERNACRLLAGLRMRPSHQHHVSRQTLRQRLPLDWLAWAVGCFSSSPFPVPDLRSCVWPVANFLPTERGASPNRHQSAGGLVGPGWALAFQEQRTRVKPRIAQKI